LAIFAGVCFGTYVRNNIIDRFFRVGFLGLVRLSPGGCGFRGRKPKHVPPARRSSGISEALVNFAKQTGGINWARMRKARF